MASILSNASIASGGRFINAGIGIFVTVLLTRLLTPAGYGQYSAILSYAMLFQIAGDLGLYLTLTRLLGKSSQHRADIAAAVSLRMSLLGVLFFIGLLGAHIFSPFPGLNLALGILMVGLLLQSLSQLCIGIYQAASTIWPATVGDCLGRLIQLAGIGWVFWVGSRQAVLLATVMFTAGAAVAFIVHLYLLPHRRFFWPRVSWPQWQELIKVSWPLGLLLVLNTIYFRVDMVMLPIWRHASEVGLYALAYRLIENLLFFPAMFGGLLLPHFSQALASERGRHLLSETLKVIVLGASAISLLLLVLPEVIIGYIGGSQFLGAAILVKILTIAFILMCFGNIFGFVLVAQGKNKTLLTLYAILVGLNITANVIFIPRFGAVAAAWITVVTELIAASTAGVIVVRSIRPSYDTFWFLRWVGATAVSVAVTMSLPAALPGLLKLAVALALFGALQALVGTIKKNQFPHLLHKPETLHVND